MNNQDELARVGQGIDRSRRSAPFRVLDAQGMLFVMMARKEGRP
jgi:hypothetical protein